MRTLFKIMFVIAFVFIAVHSVRLIYMVWLEPTGSVLDKYDDQIETQVKKAKSLEELTALYDDAHRAVQAYEADDTNPTLEYHEERNTEPYKSEILLKDSIQKWEIQSRKIYQMRVYWALGSLFLVIGVVLFKRVSQWLGVSALVVAFSEMIYWSSPPYFSGGLLEYQRLINNKLFFAFLTFLLLVSAGFLSGILSDKDNKADPR